jgi:RHS repeat-associated protein
VPISLERARENGFVYDGSRRHILNYLRGRYYDPATAQFLSRDPAVSSTMSPYAYVAGNPLNVTDPSGDTPRCPTSNCNFGNSPAPDPNKNLPPCQITGKGRLAQQPCAWPDAGPGVAWQHTVFSYGGCFGVCLSITLQNGHLQVKDGGYGFLGRGPGIGWANLPPDQREPSSFEAGGGYIAGAQGSVGVSASGCVNWSDTEVDLYPGVGGSVGPSVPLLQIDIPFLQW